MSKSDVPKSGVRHVIGLPSFLVDKPIGLGDVIKRATTRMGVKPCGGCNKRAEQLNQWVRLEPTSNGHTPDNTK